MSPPRTPIPSAHTMDGPISASAVEQPATRSETGRTALFSPSHRPTPASGPPSSPAEEQAPITVGQAKRLIQHAIHEARIVPASETLCDRAFGPAQDAESGDASVSNDTSTTSLNEPIHTPTSTSVLAPGQSAVLQSVNGNSAIAEPDAVWQGFKEVKEVWNEKMYEYEIVEPAKQVGELGELDGYIFVVRQRVGKTTEEVSFHVDIKSTPLRDALQVVLERVRDADLRGNKPSVPQNLLFNVLPELKSYRQNLTLDDPISGHLDELINFIEKTYTDTNSHVQSLLAHGEITYDLLWALFKPNCLLFTTCLGTRKPRCVRHVCGEEKRNMYGTKYWSLDCRYNDFDGKEIGEVPMDVQITKFRGSKLIHELEAFPIQYHPRVDEVKSELIDCGKRFVSLRGAHHRHCKGEAFFLRKGEPVGLQVDSRVMIDAASFKKANPMYSRPKINGAATQRGIRFSSLWCVGFGTESDGRNETGEASECGKSDEGKPTDPSPTPEWHGDDQKDMTEEALMLCCPTVRGLSFKDKLWLEFAVADIEKIDWSTDAADCWIATEEDKEVLIALAEAHLTKEPDHGFDDFIKGKGRGLNILLHGRPGVGKTLTAEALAEYMKCPLYSISAGELALHAGELEAQLSLIFEIAQRWGAIILLDEADVYLEQRSSRDLTRNGLVSVFLRKMEFCEAIMFLTTNRVTEFDEAVLSRVHLAMKYANLDRDRRKLIWKIFLDRASNSHGKADISDKELDKLDRIELNGRQIKNVVATACALASKTSRVRYTHLETAIAAGKKFIDDFYGTNYKSMY